MQRQFTLITGAATLALWLAGTEVAAAGHWPSFGRWQTATNVTAVNDPNFPEGCPIETPDGLSLLFASTRSGGANDIWASDRASLASPWGEPRKLEEPISLPGAVADFCPSPAYGRSLFFVSSRPASNCGGPSSAAGDIYLSRQSPAGGWSEPVHLACAKDGGPNTPGAEFSPSLVETWYGTFLFFSSPGAAGDQDIFVSRMRPNGTFGPGRVVETLSTPHEDMMPNVRERDEGGFEIVFNSNRPSPQCTAIESCNTQDVFASVAWFIPGPWAKPVNLGAAVNTAGAEQRATLSRDGKRLSFGRSGEIFMSERR